MAQVLDQRYEVGPPLGTGGMSEVFEGYDRNLDRRVAVKFLKAEVADPRARERFEHEARAAASFTHPNAVTVYDFGEAGTRPYIVMELVEGKNLAEVLSQTSPLPPGQAAKVTDQILAALGAAHSRGLVHRDVKPGNVLVKPDGSVKLADFGIAKAVADATGGLTMTGQVMGTPKYLAPEQAAGQATTPRSDLYSTGVVLYEMLAGAPPFEGDTPVAIALAHQQAPVPPLTQRRAGLPASLVATVERALEKDPARRFPSAEAMRGALAGGPTAPMAPTRPGGTEVLPAMAPPGRGGPGGRRWPWVVLGVLALVGAFLIAFALANRDDDRPTVVAEPSTTTSSTTTTTTTTTPVPDTIDELIATLAADPDAFGEKGEDLLDKLQKVQEEQNPEEAGKLIEEIDKWVDEGQLDPATGALAQQLLAPLAAQPSEDGRGPGDGGPPGQEDDEEDD
ncbi:MAG TPA: protein kinase [Acidimicrobiia bacterium]|nr:protein kinase [Acidimicrobiia bacterium]